MQIWWGVFAPAGKPTPVVDWLNSEIRAVIDTPEMRERFSHEGAEPSTTFTSEQLAGYVGAALDKWRKVANEKNITAE